MGQRGDVSSATALGGVPKSCIRYQAHGLKAQSRFTSGNTDPSCGMMFECDQMMMTINEDRGHKPTKECEEVDKGQQGMVQSGVLTKSECQFDL